MNDEMKMATEPTEASVVLRGMAARLAEPYSRHPHCRAIILTGSAADGTSDYYSDLDIILYYDELPTEEELERIRLENGGSERAWTMGDRAEGHFGEAYYVNGVQCQMGGATVAVWEETMASVLEQFDTETTTQKALMGILKAIPLHGAGLIETWRAKIAAYPEPLAAAMVRKHLSFFPLWYHRDYLATRDASLWIRQSLVEAAFNIFGILAGINRVYFSAFQFKGMARTAATMPIKPENLLERIDRLFTVDPLDAASLLEDLVEETILVVEANMPDIDTSVVRKRIGKRVERWG